MNMRIFVISVCCALTIPSLGFAIPDQYYYKKCHVSEGVAQNVCDMFCYQSTASRKAINAENFSLCQELGTGTDAAGLFVNYYNSATSYLSTTCNMLTAGQIKCIYHEVGSGADS